MAKKQSDYLACLLAEEAGTAQAASDAKSASQPADPAASSRAGLSLLGRESALARLASGEVRQVTQLLLDPARVRVWSGNARVQALLDEDNCRDLIDSIVAEAGQKVPVVVRHVADGGPFDYELIVGTRRHFAISWLRSHSYPEMRLLAQVADLDDEAAFRLADVENRARRDISDIERARNYADALERHYGGRAVRMAERLGLSKGWLSKMLKAATLPDQVLSAFGDWHGLTLNPAYKLAVALDEPASAPQILAEAAAVTAERRQALDFGTAAPPADVVLRRLLAAPFPSAPLPRDLPMAVLDARGRAILEVKSISRLGFTVHLPAGTGADDERLGDALREVLHRLRINGVQL